MNLFKLTFNYTSIWLIVQPILYLLYIHLFIEELSWKSDVSYLATCPIKKEGGLSGRESLKLLA